MKIVFNPFTGNFDWVNDGTVTGSGTATRVAFWSTANNISSDSALYWDNTNKRLGVGTASPSQVLHIVGDTRIDGSVDIGNGSASEYSIEIGASRTGNGFAYIDLIGDTTYTDYGMRLIRGNAGANAFNTITCRGTGGLLLETNEAAAIAFNTIAAERARITATGNFGIGTTNPTEKLVISDGGAAGFEYIPSSGRWYRFNRSTLAYGGIYTEASEHTWSIGATEHVRLSSGGNFGIGNNNPTYKLDVTGDVRIASGSLGVGVTPNATDGRIDAANDIVAYSSSDKRLKVNIKPIEGAIDKVLALNGVEYDWNPKFLDSHGYSGHDIGVIAHEVQEILPEAVRVGGHGYLMVRYEKLIPLLIQAVKEQQTYIELLMSKYDL